MMSTELSTPAKKDKKHRKDKKDKDTPSTTSKKRGREPHQPIDDLERIPDSQPTKKPKKSKSSKTTTTTLVPSSTPEDKTSAHSPFVQQTTSLYLPLSACSFHAPLEGLCAEHLSPLLLTWSAQLRGVVLSYANAHISEQAPGTSELRKRNCRGKAAAAGESEDEPSEDERNLRDNRRAAAKDVMLARSVDEYGVAFAWLTADFLLFRPRRGTLLEGFVNLQNESMLGVMCYNYFNAGIERAKLPPDWRWVEEEIGAAEDEGEGMGEGHYVDGSGKKIEGRVVFRVEDFEATTAESDVGVGIVSIIGTLLEEGASGS